MFTMSICFSVVHLSTSESSKTPFHGTLVRAASKRNAFLNLSALQCFVPPVAAVDVLPFQVEVLLDEPFPSGTTPAGGKDKCGFMCSVSELQQVQLESCALGSVG